MFRQGHLNSRGKKRYDRVQHSVSFESTWHAMQRQIKKRAISAPHISIRFVAGGPQTPYMVRKRKQR
eukprot:scaffold1362_cov125-Cylindrotheca_fusiformis.AAC.8